MVKRFLFILPLLAISLFLGQRAIAESCTPVLPDITYWQSNAGELIGGTPHLANNFTWETAFQYNEIDVPGDPTSGSQIIMENYNYPEGGLQVGFSSQVWPDLTPGFTVNKIVPSEPYSSCISRFYTSLPSLGAWHHLAVSVSPIDGTSLYIDGNKIGTDTSACAMANVINFQPLSLGVWTQGANLWNPVHGSVADFASYNRVLKNTEVQDLSGQKKCQTTAGSASVIASGDAASISSTGNPDGSTTVNLTDNSGNNYGVTLPAGASALSGNSIVLDVLDGPRPGVKVDAVLSAGTTKTVSISKGTGNQVCIKDKSGAQLGGTACNGGNLVTLPAAGTCSNPVVDGDPADGPHAVNLCVNSSNTTITISGLLHSVVEGTVDSDADGWIDEQDHCPGTVMAGPDPKTKPGRLDDSKTIYGCNKTQILKCKPGENEGEKKFGLTWASQLIFKSKKYLPIAWANDCIEMYPNP